MCLLLVLKGFERTRASISGRIQLNDPLARRPKSNQIRDQTLSLQAFALIHLHKLLVSISISLAKAGLARSLGLEKEGENAKDN